MSDFGDDIGLITPDMIRAAGKSNETYLKLTQMIQGGFPRTRHLTHPLVRQFWEVRHRLTVDKGLIMMDSRIVIRLALRRGYCDVYIQPTKDVTECRLVQIYHYIGQALMLISGIISSCYPS